MKLAEATQKINAILADLEATTGQLVARVEIETVDITKVTDSAPSILRTVSIWLNPIPVSSWQT